MLPIKKKKKCVSKLTSSKIVGGERSLLINQMKRNLTFLNKEGVENIIRVMRP